MEPGIQYAKTVDGLNIAFCAMGEGEPFVDMPYVPFSHLQLDWQIPERRRWCERLAESWKTVRYDGRGTGLSERDVTDYSLDAQVADLEAVVDRLSLESFALFAMTHAGPVAIAYAARHPERISRLILWCSYARASQWLQSPQIQSTRTFMDKDWATYTETVGHAVLAGWEAGKMARQMAAVMRESITQEAMQALTRATNEIDVTDLLAHIRAPTLVLHRRQAPVSSIDAARGLASGIENARLALLEGMPVMPYMGDMESVLAAIDDFVGDTSITDSATRDAPSGTAVILFADIADSTALTERLGDSAFREKTRELDGMLRDTIRECEGTAIEGKLLGDGVLAVFRSARQAIEAALRCAKAGESGGLPLHLGLHAGDVIREDNNIYGGAVNIAARISGLSAPGEVLVSDTVRSLGRTSAGVAFEDRGEQALKGVGEPVRLYEVQWLE